MKDLDDLTGDQIVEYAKRSGYRVVVLEKMVLDAIDLLPPRFTCLDIVEAIPRDDRGNRVSEYLVACWCEHLVRNHRIRWVLTQGAARVYEIVPRLELKAEALEDRMHCGTLSYNLGVDVEWCPRCGSLRVNADRWIAPQRVFP